MTSGETVTTTKPACEILSERKPDLEWFDIKIYKSPNLQIPDFTIIVVKLLLIVNFTLMAVSLNAQDSEDMNHLKNIEISSGFAYMIYQSGYGLNGSSGIEVLFSKRISHTLKAEIGFRSTINPILPEGFIRGIIFRKFGIWKPAIGVETGITDRANFESSSNLLKESKEAMLEDVGYSYLSTHVELLSFLVAKKMNVSLLEFDTGTHYRYFGRTLRAQTILIRIRKTF